MSQPNSPSGSSQIRKPLANETHTVATTVSEPVKNVSDMTEDDRLLVEAGNNPYGLLTAPRLSTVINSPGRNGISDDFVILVFDSDTFELVDKTLFNYAKTLRQFPHYEQMDEWSMLLETSILNGVPLVSFEQPVIWVAAPTSRFRQWKSVEPSDLAQRLTPAHVGNWLQCCHRENPLNLARA